jgi:PKD repeat protein
MSIYKPFLISILLLSSWTISGQDRCSSTDVENWIREKYPNLESQAEFEDWMSSRIKTLRSSPQKYGVLTIPVVFHIIHNNSNVGSSENPNSSVVQAQLQQINNDFRKVLGSSGFSTNPVAADTEIEFCLALVDPSGNVLAEPGINRINRVQRGWIEPPYGACVDDKFNPSYIENTIKPSSQWDPEKYLNIWVMNMSCNVLGYAQFPSTSGLFGLGSYGGLATTDGVVIRPITLGSSQSPNPGSLNYGWGRTLTHELGHFFGLRHIWGDSACGNDFCDDTPQQIGPARGCPESTTCDGIRDQVENYMDYSGDQCVNLFTRDQKTRMQTVLANSPRRGSLVNSSVCGSNSGVLTANFYGTPYSINPGQTVSFYSISSGNPITYQWSFPGGNPSSSTLKNPQVSYSHSGTYAVTLTVRNASGGTNTQTKNGYITVNTSATGGGLTCTSGLTLFPYLEGFESPQTLWTQSSGDDFDWVRISGSTPSSGTGPTKANEGNFYFYIESSTPNYPGKTAILNSPCLNFTAINTGFLSFDYHLYSTDDPSIMGSLKVEGSRDGNTWEVLWEKSGTTNETSWKSALVDLSRYARVNGFFLRFNAKTGTSWKNDMGLDNIRIGQNLTAANHPPSSAFTGTPTTLSPGSAVTFSVSSPTGSPPPTYNWTFDGGLPQTSTALNPVVTYNQSGQYNVRLIASNNHGNDTTLKVNYINVTPLVQTPTAAFTANKRILYVGDSVVYDDISIGNVTSRSWTFEGGNPSSSNIIEPIIKYETAGIYDVTLTVSNNGDSNTLIQRDFITVLPSTPPIEPCGSYGIRAFPYLESFENATSSTWNDATSDDDFNWTRNSGNTPSGNTGPPSAIDGSFYYFIESSTPNYPLKTAILNSNCFDFTGFGQLSFSFKYHMYGLNTGTLTLQTDNGSNNWTTLWTLSGDQGNQWKTSTIDIGALGGKNNVKFRFVGTTKDGWQGDIAIDEIRVLTTIGNTIPPVANFKASSTTGYQGYSVLFSDLSLNNPTFWNWSFPGGSPTTSTLKNPIVTYQNSGTYSVKLVAGNLFGQDTLEIENFITVESECADSILALPYAESFEYTIGIWKNSEADSKDWIVKAITDPTDQPNKPDTSFSDTSYIYFETTALDSAILETSCLDLQFATSPILSFAYFTNGAGVDSLKLQATTDSLNWFDLWKVAGSQGTQWKTHQIDIRTLAAQGLFRLRFFGFAGASDAFFALDEIEIKEFNASPGCVATINTFPDSTYFEFDLFPWTQDQTDSMDWVQFFGPTPSAETGPDSAYLGSRYMYIEASALNNPDKLARLISPCYDFTSIGSATLSFYKHMRGTDIGTLVLESTNDQVNWDTLFIQNGPSDSSIDWEKVEINLDTAQASILGLPSVQFRFSGITGNGWKGDIGLDYFKISTTSGSSGLPPFANFTTDKVRINATDSIQFRDLSMNQPTTWEWTLFGVQDTFTSSAKNTIITFNQLDTFDVQLIVSNAFGIDTLIKENYIIVDTNLVKPTPGFTVSASRIQANQSITFTDTSTNYPTSWNWLITNELGQTITTNTSKSFTHNFSASDTLTVRLIVENNIGLDSLTKTNLIIVDPLSTPFCTSPISNSTPLVMDFESGSLVPGWKQNSADDFDWTFNSGRTPSLGTGPTSAHQGNNYLFIESSAPNSPFKRAILETECFDLRAVRTMTMSFAYHMNGRDIGTLSVQGKADTSSNWTTLWSASGDQGDRWQTATINLNSFVGREPVYFRIVGMTGQSWQGDIAIDSINIYTTSGDLPPVANFTANKTQIGAGESIQFTNLSIGSTNAVGWVFEGGTPSTSVELNPTVRYDSAGIYKVSLIVGNSYGQDQMVKNNYIIVNPTFNVCDGVTTTLPYREGFENGFGIWTQPIDDDFNWERNSGPTSSSGTGPNNAFEGNYYIFIESSSPNYPIKTAILESKCINLSELTKPMIGFAYHAFGGEVGTLKLEGKLRDSTNWITLFEKSGNQGSAWKQEVLSLDTFQNLSTLNLRFVATTSTSWQSDIAIDQIEFFSGGNLFTAEKFILEEPTIQVFPNPASLDLTLNYKTGQTGTAEVMIFDFMGNRVLQSQMDVFVGENIEAIDIGRFAAGTYILIIQQDGMLTRKRFIKI